MLRKAAADCGVDPRAVTVSVVALDGLRMPRAAGCPSSGPCLPSTPDRSVAPASTAKLVTTLAGLELLGADWKWRTGFYAKARPDAEGPRQRHLAQGAAAIRRLVARKVRGSSSSGWQQMGGQAHRRAT